MKLDILARRAFLVPPPRRLVLRILRRSPKLDDRERVQDRARKASSSRLTSAAVGAASVALAGARAVALRMTDRANRLREERLGRERARESGRTPERMTMRNMAVTTPVMAYCEQALLTRSRNIDD